MRRHLVPFFILDACPVWKDEGMYEKYHPVPGIFRPGNQFGSPLQDFVARCELQGKDENLAPDIVAELVCRILEGVDILPVRGSRHEMFHYLRIPLGIDIFRHLRIPVLRRDVAYVVIPLAGDVRHLSVEESQGMRNRFPLLARSLRTVREVREASGNEFVVLLHEISRKQGSHHVQPLCVLGYPGRLQVEKRLRGGELDIALGISEHYHGERLRVFQFRIDGNDRLGLFYLGFGPQRNQHHGNCRGKYYQFMFHYVLLYCFLLQITV